MSLDFPNCSRSYDSTSGAIRFWGHDGLLEVPFFMEAGILSGIAPGTNRNEAGALQSFDRNWDRNVRAAGNMPAGEAHGRRQVPLAADRGWRHASIAGAVIRTS
jgi:hypothetical protein